MRLTNVIIRLDIILPHVEVEPVKGLDLVRQDLIQEALSALDLGFGRWHASVHACPDLPILSETSSAPKPN